MIISWWQCAVGVVGGICILWIALVIVMALSARGDTARLSMVGALRLVPDVIRLTSRIVSDRSISRWVRAWVAVLALYLLSPIDLIPDFIPVIGYVDDAIIVAMVLRFTMRRAGPDVIDRHWPGTPEGLCAVHTLVGSRRIGQGARARGQHPSR